MNSIKEPICDFLRSVVTYCIWTSVSVIYYTMKILNLIFELILTVIQLLPLKNSFRQNLNKLRVIIPPDIRQRYDDYIMCHGQYRVETHKIITEDQYILTAWRVHRLEGKRHDLPVVLGHGLLDCSFSWFLNQKRGSCLPFILADQGYDVWILNNRGNRYSIGHLQFRNLKSNQFYWDYSFDDLAKYDVIANIMYVKNYCQCDKVLYIGHSQGSTQFFAHLTENLTLQKHVQAFIALGPAINLERIENNFVKGLFGLKFFELCYSLGFKSFLIIPRGMSQQIGSLVHYLPFIFGWGFDRVVHLLCGFPDVRKIDREKIDIVVTHEPGGASLKNIVQWCQFFQSQKLQKFDHGQKLNMKIYGTEQPPAYLLQNLQKVQLPMYLFMGEQDSVGFGDFESLVSLLPQNNVQAQIIPDYGHLDYVWGMDANVVLYPRILQIIQEHCPIQDAKA